MTVIRTQRWSVRLVWAHIALFALLALLCYLSPETAIGPGAWLPLPRLAVLLLAATLLTLSILLAGLVRSGSMQLISMALLASLAIDIQFPIMLLSQPAILDYLEADLGLRPFLPILAFVLLGGFTAYGLLTIRDARRSSA